MWLMCPVAPSLRDFLRTCALMTPSLRGFLRNQTTIRTSNAPELLAALTPDSFGIFVVEHPTLQKLHRMSAYNRMAAKDREP